MGNSIYVDIDGDQFGLTNSHISGIQLLGLVDKSPKEWALNIKYFDGRRVRVKDLTVPIDITYRNIHRFETVKLQAIQGS